MHSVSPLAAVIAPDVSFTVIYVLYGIAILAGVYLWLMGRRK
jgi:hypothetical protein